MRLQDKYGSPFRFWLMYKPFIVINAPEDFEVPEIRVRFSYEGVLEE